MNTPEAVQFPALDGTPLGGTWHHGLAARAVVLVAGGTAVPHRFYGRWAADLARRGFDVLTFDFRGVGASKPPSPRDATMTQWATHDLGGALRLAEQHANGRPVLFVGHSFGGQALGLLDGGERLAGVVTIGAGWGWAGYQPAWKRPLLGFVWRAWLPLVVGLFGYVPGRMGLGEGLPGGVAHEWRTWCSHPDYLLAFVPDARARFARVGGPVTVLSLSDDGYIPTPAVQPLAKALPVGEFLELDATKAGGLGHFGFFRPNGQVYWELVADRLQDAVERAATRRAG